MVSSWPPTRAWQHDRPLALSVVARLLAAEDQVRSRRGLITGRTSPDNKGRTLEMYAAHFGHLEALAMLLQRAGGGVGVLEARDAEGRSVLMYAVMRTDGQPAVNETQVCRALGMLLEGVEAEEVLAIQDGSGKTALTFAAEAGLFQACRLMLQCGGSALLQATDADGQSSPRHD